MTTLNTIIEEEKKGLNTRFVNWKQDPEFWKEDIKDTFTTAMQRAYEAGRQETVGEVWMRLEKAKRTNTSIREEEIPDDEVWNDTLTQAQLMLEDITNNIKDITSNTKEEWIYMRILRDIIALPIFTLGIIIILISSVIGGRDYSNELITKLSEK